MFCMRNILKNNTCGLFVTMVLYPLFTIIIVFSVFKMILKRNNMRCVLFNSERNVLRCFFESKRLLLGGLVFRYH